MLKTIYALEPLPKKVTKTIFLAGSTPRAPGMPSWRPEALEILKKLGYDGHVFIPEPRDGNYSDDRFNYDNQIEWEDQFLNAADCIVFWVPRNMETMPAMTTNIEFGEWHKSGKVVFGAPPDAEKIRYLVHKAVSYGIPISHTLKDTLINSIKFIGVGGLRSEEDVKVPINVWGNRTFQDWLNAQRSVDNRVENVRVKFTHRPKSVPNKVFLWIVSADVFVESEQRIKKTDLVIARSHIARAVLYYPQANPMDTIVALVREYRKNGSQAGDPFSYELPGGEGDSPDDAVREVYEETGLQIDVASDNFQYHGGRQSSSSFGAHMNFLCSYRLTDEQLQYLREVVNQEFGDEEERTRVILYTVETLLKDECVDLTTKGAIFEALYS